MLWTRSLGSRTPAFNLPDLWSPRGLGERPRPPVPSVSRLLDKQSHERRFLKKEMEERVTHADILGIRLAAPCRGTRTV